MAARRSIAVVGALVVASGVLLRSPGASVAAPVPTTATVDPAVAAIDALLARPGLIPSERAKLLPRRRARKAAVAEVLRRGHGLRYFDPRWITLADPMARRGTKPERERSLQAWEVVLILLEGQGAGVFELLDDPSRPLRQEAAWALVGSDVGAYPNRRGWRSARRAATG